MGFRYRKSIKLPGGFRVNTSKSGVGYSFGAKSFRVTKTAKGTIRSTATLPGTGISYVEESSANTTQPENQKASFLPILAFVVTIFIASCLLLIFALTLPSKDANTDRSVIQNTQSLKSGAPPVPNGMKEAVYDILSSEIEIEDVRIKRGESYLTAIIASTTVFDIWERYSNYDDSAIDEWRALRATLEKISGELPESLNSFSDKRPVSFQLMDNSDEVILLAIMKGKTSYDTVEKLECGRKAAEQAPAEEPDQDTLRDESSAVIIDEPYVWITAGGEKYHSTTTCSSMSNPISVLLSEALQKGLKPCKTCYG